MAGNLVELMVWSYGLAAGGYALLALYLFGQARTVGGSSLRATVMLAAVVLSLCWSLLALGSGLSGSGGLYFIAMEADVMRYGAWYAFLLLLLRPVEKCPRQRAHTWVSLTVAFVVLSGLVVQALLVARFAPIGLVAAWLPFHPLVMAVLGLFLLEQLLRNVAADSRWSIKPLSLGLGGAYLFDLYVYSDALLFGRLDPDAVVIRGFVNALVIPLVALSAARSRDWTRKIVLSRTVVMHTTGLLAVGGYLLFMAAVGYYVRYFGGDWGRAFQLALAFAALLGLAVLAFSGATRAWLRVVVGKNFFRYRYDYREEWLKVTRALSAQQSPRAMGEQVIRGLSDMVESPGGPFGCAMPPDRPIGSLRAGTWRRSTRSRVRMRRFAAFSGTAVG